MPPAFLSPAPEVHLVNRFDRPFENAIATARTCYSARGVITPAEVSGDALTDPDKRDARVRFRDELARSIYDAGHHTTLQHAHFQFTLDRVSRQFLWTFLHSHPFYNSEQVSQRYVEVKPGTFAIPPLAGEALAVYERTVALQMDHYHRLIDLLSPAVAGEYFGRFPARRGQSKYDKDVKKKAQEIARYVLPVSTFAYLYHTVSGLGLLRYYRVCEQLDAPAETRAVVQRMVEELLAADPLFRTILEQPLPIEDTPEYRYHTEHAAEFGADASESCAREFDASLAGRVSALVDYKAHAPAIVAQSVREVFGLPRERMTDAAALDLLLHPARNGYLTESLNVTSLTKLSRCLNHASYTFRKKLSHTADSQDQRHRMTPASRPCLTLQATDRPDYVEPAILAAAPVAAALYRESMVRSWEAFAALRRLGVSREFACYVLPNAWSVRFTESADLLHLHHKLKFRLCYNAQEEIWRASFDEQQQIEAVHPQLGRYLLPPCGILKLAEVKPYCPEGARYCGVPVWKLARQDYRRTI